MVGADVRAVDIEHAPVNAAFVQCQVQTPQDAVEELLPRLAPVGVVDAWPLAVAFGHATPLAVTVEDPEHAVERRVVIVPSPTTLLPGQQRLDPLPRVVRELVPAVGLTRMPWLLKRRDHHNCGCSGTTTVVQMGAQGARMDHKKTEIIRVRLSSDQKRLVEAAASRAGLSTSSWIRMVALQAVTQGSQLPHLVTDGATAEDVHAQDRKPE